MGFFKDHWKALLMGTIAVFNGIIGVLSLLGYILSYSFVIIANFCLSIIYPVIEMVDKISEKNKVVTAKIPVKLNEDITIVKEKLESIEKEIKDEKPKVEEKKRENRILVDLINSNVISLKTLDDNILDKKFISVLCYQAGFNIRSGLISKSIKDKIDEDIMRKRGGKKTKYDIEINREYSKIFEGIGFIKLAGTNPFFIIPQDNIYPEKLRDLDKISDYLIKQGSLIVHEEWIKLKNVYKKHDINFYNQMKERDNPVNFNILIMKINRRDMRQRFILRNDFNKEFSSELSAVVRLDKFKTSQSEKLEIKNIVSQSSLKILILSLHKSEQDKILDLENEFKKPEKEGGLGIVNFFDYHNKNIDTIKKILSKKIKGNKKISEYAELIYNNSRDYKKDLEELGINFA